MRPFLAVCAAASALFGHAGCDERPGGVPVISLAECTALGGQPTVAAGDGGAPAGGCGETGILLGYLDSTETGQEGGLCCQ